MQRRLLEAFGASKLLLVIIHPRLSLHLKYLLRLLFSPFGPPKKL